MRRVWVNMGLWILVLAWACLPVRMMAAGWETFVPDLIVIAAFDVSSEEMKKAVDRDRTLNVYMGKVTDLSSDYKTISYDLINHARYAYGNREDGSFSVSGAIEANPVSSLKQYKNLYKTITRTVEYYTQLTGYLCSGDFANPLVKAQTLECLLTQGYEAFVVLEEYWNLKKDETDGGRIIERDILWYVDIANNLNKRLDRINRKLYAQVRLVRGQRMMEPQDMQEWIRRRAERKVREDINHIKE